MNKPNGMDCKLYAVNIMDCLCHEACICGEVKVDKHTTSNGNTYYVCAKCNICRGGTCCGKKEINSIKVERINNEVKNKR